MPAPFDLATKLVHDLPLLLPRELLVLDRLDQLTIRVHKQLGASETHTLHELLHDIKELDIEYGFS
jgi:hypothetical protein